MRELLKVRDLKKYFPVEGGIFKRTIGWVKAVDGISFEIQPGEILGLVGESGSGKTTTGKLIVKLLEPGSGEIRFGQKNIGKIKRTDYSRKVQVIFQDPFSSLNPRLSVGTILGEAVRIRGQIVGAPSPLTLSPLGRGKGEGKEGRRQKKDIEREVKKLLQTVGLPTNILNDYPHQFSGGQRQRVGIARALAMQPELLVADEPVSSLDISIQAQIINLLLDLREKFNLAMLFISHDLSVVKYVADRIAVMRNGKIVEVGPTANVIRTPAHPYTQKLLGAVPALNF